MVFTDNASFIVGGRQRFLVARHRRVLGPATKNPLGLVILSKYPKILSEGT